MHTLMRFFKFLRTDFLRKYSRVWQSSKALYVLGNIIYLWDRSKSFFFSYFLELLSFKVIGSFSIWFCIFLFAFINKIFIIRFHNDILWNHQEFFSYLNFYYLFIEENVIKKFFGMENFLLNFDRESWNCVLLWRKSIENLRKARKVLMFFMSLAEISCIIKFY